jgi:aminopeptidase
MDADPRVRAYADLLLDYSLGVQPGWQVLVATTAEALPLARELSRGLGARGAWALTRLVPGNPYPVDLDWIEAAPAELASEPAPLEREVLGRIDASVFALAPAPGRVPATAGAERAHRAQLLAYRARGRSDEIPSVRCDFPCAFFAAAAGLPLEEYEELFYDACLRDWPAEGERMRAVRDRLAGAADVRMVGAGTDLRLSLAGRPGAVDDGHANVPGGEVYFCPVEDSLEGTISFDVPTGNARDVSLTFRSGEVVEASASEGQEHLDRVLAIDDGARRAGELGIGCNDGIPRPTGNVLFDEKLAGTIHVALGDGFPQLGGRNRSALHWDLVKDMKPGGELWIDGALAQRDGVWL